MLGQWQLNSQSVYLVLSPPFFLLLDKWENLEILSRVWSFVAYNPPVLPTQSRSLPTHPPFSLSLSVSSPPLLSGFLPLSISIHEPWFNSTRPGVSSLRLFSPRHPLHLSSSTVPAQFCASLVTLYSSSPPSSQPKISPVRSLRHRGKGTEILRINIFGLFIREA